jgi:hypothetical protein
VGGFGGVLFRAGIFAELYPRLEKTVLKRGEFGDATLPEILGNELLAGDHSSSFDPPGSAILDRCAGSL